MRMYWIELRRSPLLWCIPLLITVDLAAIFGRSRWWIGVWPQASAAAQIPSIFFAPVFAAAAAWAVSRSLRRGVAEQRSAAARAGWKIELTQFAATLTYGLATYLVGAIAAAIVTVKDGGPGFLWPSYLLLGAATITICAAIGHCVGTWTQSAYAAPVICGLACFVFLGSLGRLFGLFVLSGPPDAQIEPGVVAARLFFAAILIVIATLGRPTTRRQFRGWAKSRNFLWVRATSAVAAPLALIALPATGPVQTERPAPSHPSCSTGSPRVCVWPEDRKYLPQLTKMAARLADIPQDWVKTPEAFYERGLRGPMESANDFEVVEGNMWLAVPSMVGNVIQASVVDDCSEIREDSQQKVSMAMFELQVWLEFRATGAMERTGVYGGPPVDHAAISAVARESEAAQAAWTSERLELIREAPCVS